MVLVIKFSICAFLFSTLVGLAVWLVLFLLGSAVGKVFSNMYLWI